MSTQDKLTEETKYGRFVANLCNGNNNKDINWGGMRKALLRRINGSRIIEVNFPEENQYHLTGRENISILLKIYEALEDHLEESQTDQKFKEQK